MTQKHFQMLADGLKATWPQPEPDETVDSRSYIGRANQWHRDVRIIADVCKSVNVNFDRDKFYAACGMVD